MRILARIDDKIDTMIIGWAGRGEGKGNYVVAIVLWPNPDGSYGCREVKLSDLKFPYLPDKLQRFLRKQAKKLREDVSPEC
jgi:hypothetical protein